MQIETYFIEFTNLVDVLSTLEPEKWTKETVLEEFLEGLHSRYDDQKILVQEIEQDGASLKYDDYHKVYKLLVKVKGKGLCYFCGEHGHMKPSCKKFIDFQQKQRGLAKTESSQSKPPSHIKCMICGENGHFTANCSKSSS